MLRISLHHIQRKDDSEMLWHPRDFSGSSQRTNPLCLESPSLKAWRDLKVGFDSGFEARESPTRNSLRLPLSKLLFTEPRPLSRSQLSIHTCQVQSIVDLEDKSKKKEFKKSLDFFAQ